MAHYTWEGQELAPIDRDRGKKGSDTGPQNQVTTISLISSITNNTGRDQLSDQIRAYITGLRSCGLRNNLLHDIHRVLISLHTKHHIPQYKRGIREATIDLLTGTVHILMMSQKDMHNFLDKNNNNWKTLIRALEQIAIDLSTPTIWTRLGDIGERAMKLVDGTDDTINTGYVSRAWEQI